MTDQGCCTCNDSCITTRRCMNCRNEWQEELSDPEKGLQCSLHRNIIQVHGFPVYLCDSCDSDGYRINRGIFPGVLPTVEKVDPVGKMQ